MKFEKKNDLNLKVGNLALAVILSTVPTVMTILFLNIHGLFICNTLESNLKGKEKLTTIEFCHSANTKLSYSYLVWIWLFISIPTWAWFYLNHQRKLEQASRINKKYLPD